MLDELISQGLRDFQTDCLRFCEHHYPTIHNRGMKESHLGKAQARRLVHCYSNLGIDAGLLQLEEESLKHPVFLIDTPEHQIYVVAHRMISANIAGRKALVNDIHWALNHRNQESTKEKRLISIADHWADRSSASKSLPSWWLGHQPIHVEEFASQGIKLLDANHHFSDDIAKQCQLSGGKLRIYHPFHRQRDGLPFYKYMLLTASYPIE